MKEVVRQYGKIVYNYSKAAGVSKAKAAELIKPALLKKFRRFKSLKKRLPDYT